MANPGNRMEIEFKNTKALSDAVQRLARRVDFDHKKGDRIVRSETNRLRTRLSRRSMQATGIPKLADARKRWRPSFGARADRAIRTAWLNAKISLAESTAIVHAGRLKISKAAGGIKIAGQFRKGTFRFRPAKYYGKKARVYKRIPGKSRIQSVNVKPNLTEIVRKFGSVELKKTTTAIMSRLLKEARGR